jgi:hypothetical protein
MSGTAEAVNGRAGAAAFFAVLALVLGVFLLKDKLVEPPPVSASAPFDTARAFARLERILGDQRPHTVDSEANDAVRERLLAEITALGHTPEVRDDFACRSSIKWGTSACARVRNVIFRMGPAGGNAILVASHYDSVPAGPGASDDGAGVAASLEIAALLKERELQRPVIFLITEGEELALLGAASFVRKDPYAKDVAAIVNMEARGVAGQAIMFESGTPNGRELLAFAGKATRPVGNSLATAIYKMMDNDTDMSELLTLAPDALNFAYADRSSFYHTPYDNLANLDKRSLGHIGASAFGAVEGLLGTKANEPDPELAFVDILGRTLIIFPHFVAIGLFAAGLAAGALLYIRTGGGGFIRAALVPPIAVALGGALAFGAFFLLKTLRPGEMFWAAHPAPAQAALYLSAIAGASAAILLLGATANRGRLAAAGWLWFVGLAAAGFLFVPGSAGLTAPLAGVFAVAALIALLAPRALPATMAAAALAAFLIFAPMLAFAESALGLGDGWIFAPVAALLVCLALPPALSDEGRPGWWSVPAIIGALAVAMGAATWVPAHSPLAPMAMNIVHYSVPSQNTSWWVLPDARTPSARFAATAPFEKRKLDGYRNEQFAAPAPKVEPIIGSVETTILAVNGDQRRIGFKITSDNADAVVVVIPSSAGLASLDIGGETLKPTDRNDWILRCWGRSCRTLTFEATIGPVPQEWDVYGARFGLDKDGAALIAARTATEMPVQNGDLRREWRAVKP